MKTLYIDTCVLPRCRLEEAEYYDRHLGKEVGFELLPMFDLDAFEANLNENLSLFSKRPLIFHEPVWGVEHSAPKGSDEYSKSMYHVMLTKKAADALHPSDMVFHLNNCRVQEDRRQQMLETALENLEEMRQLFSGVRILVENTGTAAVGDCLLDQEAFTCLCLERNLDVLIDVGHANANSWDILKLTEDLKANIRGYHLHNNDGFHDQHHRLREGTIDFPKLLPMLDERTPDAFWVIEYTDPALHGMPVLEDARLALSCRKQA